MERFFQIVMMGIKKSSRTICSPRRRGRDGENRSRRARRRRVAALSSTLRYPKNRSGRGSPSVFSTAAEIERRLNLPPAAAALNSPGTSFTPAPEFASHPSLMTNKSTANKAVLLFVVEMGRIDLPSESASSGTSPGADGYLHSLIRAQAVMLADLVAS